MIDADCEEITLAEVHDNVERLRKGGIAATAWGIIQQIQRGGVPGSSGSPLVIKDAPELMKPTGATT